MGLEATDYWIRDSGNVVYIVWLNADGIRDTAMMYGLGVPTDIGHDGEFLDDRVMDQDLEDNAEEHNEENESEDSFDVPTESMFNFMPLRSINSLEVREGEHVAIRMGIGATGNKLVDVTPNAGAGNISHLYWVADSPSEGEELGHFLTSVLSAL